MIDMLRLIMSLIVPTLLGYFLFLTLSKSSHTKPLFFKMSVGFGLGFGVVAQWMLLIGMIGIPYGIKSVVLPILFLTGMLFFMYFRAPRQLQEHKQRSLRLGGLEYLMAGFLAWNLFYVFLLALNVPFIGWDVLATSGFKAKIIYFERSLEYLGNFPCFSYPLHVIFSEVWVSLVLGSWHEQFVKIIFPFTFLAFLGTYYYFLSQFVSRRWTMLGLVLLVSSNFFTFHAGFAYRDLTLAYYSCSAIMFLILWHKNMDLSWLFCAALFSGFSSFVKTEGLIHVAIHLSTLGLILFLKKDILFKNKINNFFKYILINFLLCSAYPFYILFVVSDPNRGKDFNIHHFVFEFSKEKFLNIYVILTRIAEDLFLLGNWNIVWFLFGISLFSLNKKNITSEVLILLFSLGCFFAIVVFGFSFSSFYVKIAYQYDILSRCILQFFPLVPALIVLILHSSREDVLIDNAGECKP